MGSLRDGYALGKLLFFLGFTQALYGREPIKVHRMIKNASLLALNKNTFLVHRVDCRAVYSLSPFKTIENILTL